MKNIRILILLILAVVLLMCLMKMPYSYYQFVRISCCIGFVALSCIGETKAWQSFVFDALAVLFNPIFPIRMERFTWNVIDLIVSIVLLTFALYGYLQEQQKITSNSVD